MCARFSVRGHRRGSNVANGSPALCSSTMPAAISRFYYFPTVFTTDSRTAIATVRRTDFTTGSQTAIATVRRTDFTTGSQTAIATVRRTVFTTGSQTAIVTVRRTDFTTGSRTACVTVSRTVLTTDFQRPKKDKEGQDGVCQQTGDCAAAKRRDPTASRGPYAFLIAAVTFRCNRRSTGTTSRMLF
jgi:hypothetical protein